MWYITEENIFDTKKCFYLKGEWTNNIFNFLNQKLSGWNIIKIISALYIAQKRRICWNNLKIDKTLNCLFKLIFYRPFINKFCCIHENCFKW